jgi:hypothetical protein
MPQNVLYGSHESIRLQEIQNMQTAVRRTKALMKERVIPNQMVQPGILMMILAIILMTNYVLVRQPNIKLFDVLVFVTGYTLGFRRGALVAVAGWLIYGNFNPFGPTTATLLAVVSLSQVIYAAAGAFLRIVLSNNKIKFTPGYHTLLIGLLAILTTLSYDLITNLYTGLTWASLAGSSDTYEWLKVAVFNPGALYFSFAHVVSNALFFVGLSPLLVRLISKLEDTRKAD